MADVTPLRVVIQQDEVAYKAANSEATFSRIGSSINHIHYYQAPLMSFKINGGYAGAAPFLGVDGLLSFPFNWSIVEIKIASGPSTAGTGTTEIDVKWKPYNSGSYASIFTTSPKFTSSASSFESIGVGQTKTGFTAPVISKTDFDANDQIRVDLIQALTSGDGVYLTIFFRPR